MNLLRKLETDGAALMSYGRQFRIAGPAQREARDPIFVRDEHGSSCLSHDHALTSQICSIRIIDLKKKVQGTDDLSEIGRQTYLHTCANIGASSFSRLFTVIFRGGRRHVHNIQQHNTIQLRWNGEQKYTDRKAYW